MLKLFVTIMALTDTGAVSTSMTVTDMADGVACTKMEKMINSRPPVEIQQTGHKATLSMNAKCMIDGSPETAEVVVNRRGLPVQDFVGDMFQRFGRELQVR